MPYVAKTEKAGIPSVLIEFADQKTMADTTAMKYGCPNMRRVVAPRTGTGPERVAKFYDDMIKALTAPLTAKEKEGGLYTPPPALRVAFEGNLDDAQSFFQTSHPIDLCGKCPIAKMTDGLPIIVPTEEKVTEMLTGTSHKPTEMVALPVDIGTRKAGTVVKCDLSGDTFTVEKVAINAVMAGCKPQYLPAVLAISCSGMGTGTTGMWSNWQVVSGPYAKEIGMNAQMGLLGPGNPANATIGRAFQLMSVNLGGAQVGVNWTSTHNSPTNLGGMCFAENDEQLPQGWVGLNEESKYKKSESVVMCNRDSKLFIESQFAPSSYRSLQSHGEGGMAERMGVLGKAGPHNWLEYLIPGLWANDTMAFTIVMVQYLADDLKAYGFNTKQAAYEWFWKASFLTIGDFKKMGWYDFSTSGGTKKEPTSGKMYKDLPNDYLCPAAGDTPFNNCFIIAGGISERATLIPGGRGTIYPIDPWK